MKFWATPVPEPAWIAIFLVIPILFNLFNVRRYGEIEFWLTAIKITLIVGLIFLGLLLPMGASPEGQLLGTDANYHPVDCSETVIGACLPSPGFNCLILFQSPTLIYRLATGSIQILHSFGSGWEIHCLLGMLLSSRIQLHWK